MRFVSLSLLLLATPSLAQDNPRAGTKAGESWTNSIGMVFRWCPPGSFDMGGSKKKAMKVTLTQGFWISQFEVTQEQYAKVTRRKPDREVFRLGKDIPITHVGTGDRFTKSLTELERKANILPKNWSYDLPTEAEWEYACRAGSTTKYCFGDDIDQLPLYGNFADRSLEKSNPDFWYASKKLDDGQGEGPAPVGRFKPNAWGIHDMHGNVAEVCRDAFVPELPGGRDPLVKKGQDQVIRGGSWASYPKYCQSAFRNAFRTRDKVGFIGIRVILKPSK